MLTIKHSKWAKGRSKPHICEYAGNRENNLLVRENTNCGVIDRRRRSSKSIRNAAHAFLPEKKMRRAFITCSIPLSETLESEFNTLSKQWRDETFFLSSLSEICFHPAYQTIMAMGKEAVPFILKDLEKQLNHWFYALRYIARNDVANGAENLEDARQRWLTWGRKEKYLK